LTAPCRPLFRRPSAPAHISPPYQRRRNRPQQLLDSFPASAFSKSRGHIPIYPDSSGFQSEYNRSACKCNTKNTQTDRCRKARSVACAACCAFDLPAPACRRQGPAHLSSKVFVGDACRGQGFGLLPRTQPHYTQFPTFSHFLTPRAFLQTLPYLLNLLNLLKAFICHIPYLDTMFIRLRRVPWLSQK
jgi:hypothetical protein